MVVVFVVFRFVLLLGLEWVCLWGFLFVGVGVLMCVGGGLCVGGYRMHLALCVITLM